MWDLATNFVIAGLGSGFAIAVTRLWFEWRRDRHTRRDECQYLALRVAIYLEGYAVDCAQRAVDHSNAEEHEGEVGQTIGSVPQPPEIPPSESYKFIEQSILNDVLDFPQQCAAAQRAAMFWWDMLADRDCTNAAMEEQTIRMGYRALTIARRIRGRYKLKARDMTFYNWNIDEFYAKELKAIAERDEQQAAGRLARLKS